MDLSLLAEILELVCKHKTVYNSYPIVNCGYDFNFKNLPKIRYNMPLTCYYGEHMDEIHVVNFNKSKNFTDFCADIFHEMNHATHHPKRNIRKRRSYLQEEFIAEIGSYLLSEAVSLPFPLERLSMYLSRVSCVYHFNGLDGYQRCRRKVSDDYFQRNFNSVLTIIYRTFKTVYNEAVLSSQYWIDNFIGHMERKSFINETIIL